MFHKTLITLLLLGINFDIDFVKVYWISQSSLSVVAPRIAPGSRPSIPKPKDVV